MSEPRPLITDLDIVTIRTGVADGSILLVDVREPHEFQSGAIPGSMSMPLSRFDPALLARHGGRRTVFSCAAGVRSVRAIELAQAGGLALNEHFSGGFKEWAASGEPVSFEPVS